MLDVGNMSLSERCSSLLPVASGPELSKSIDDSSENIAGGDCSGMLPPEGGAVREITIGNRVTAVRINKRLTREEHVKDWVERQVASGVSEYRCSLPFLVGAKKMVDCLVCRKPVYPGEELSCSVGGCQGAYHLLCARGSLGVSTSRKFKCPQHECFVCKKRTEWRCIKCPIAAHDRHSPWQEEILHLKDQPGRAICWRHPTDWRLQNKHEVPQSDIEHEVPQSDIEEVFCQLPLPYVEEDFKLDLTCKDSVVKDEPPHYVNIRRNTYLVKKKLDTSHDGEGCKTCGPTCCTGCVCRSLRISCSKECQCSESCGNRPFRKGKKITVVKTEHCGWGVEAAEPINEDDFVVEYVGEVISDAQCEERLWNMKNKNITAFYILEITKDFTIDATFKGNASRFMNHSCNPNCILEKWQVEGEIRMGIFALREIEAGEPLTWDYNFIQFGEEVKCNCQSENCRGFLGTKKKEPNRLVVPWGAKRRRMVHKTCITHNKTTN